MVCLEADLQDGQMKEVEVDQNKILLVRNNGEFTAVGGLCTHYGAPLIKGALLGDRVQFPGLDCLPKYKKLKKRVKKMCGRVPGVTHMVVLIGGGPASLQCAETLRQNDYGGRIIMVTKDEQLPLDKTKLSKAMNIEIEKVLLRQNDFLQQHGIEVWTKKEVKSVNTEAKTLTFKDGTSQHYDQLLISTGARARTLQCPVIPLLLKMLEEKNVMFYTSNGVAEIRGKNGKVKEVVLKNGEVFPADIVIVGIGMCPNSDFLKETSSRVNIGHWQLAQAHGRISGLSMLNQQVAINIVPYFWTMLLGKSIRYTGYGEGYTDIVFKGSTEERKFLAFYIKLLQLPAASLNFDPAVARLAEMLLMGKRITKAQAQSDDLSWLQLP
uniref:Apoptosis inducing factor mitochondria associated 4 n=1 Tax=Sinocyclocheilus rhinocerous TaxID=307959 RepID=A0A673GSQ1_9TELE